MIVASLWTFFTRISCTLLTIVYSEASRLQIESIKLGFDQCVEKAIAHVQLDERFLDFYNWASSAGIPVVVLSGGLTTLIEATLEKLIGRKPQDIEVVTNSVVTKEGFKSINEDGGAWRVQFRDDSIYGNDKARAIKLYLEHRETIDEADKPILLFAGDGISDLGAAGQTDLLFAKHGKGTELPHTHRH
jgi:2-hydroxy-3-keto-5-methylthiopentenyl-1-phosphate phosphatase